MNPLHDLCLQDLPGTFDGAIAYWHTDPAEFRMAGSSINPLALELAYKNYLLWHEEDKARRTDVTDGTIALVKRAIDKLNQQRNDFIERLDEEILGWLDANSSHGTATDFNSETPGSIVDRISIFSLKVYHMEEDSRRGDISVEHRQRSLQRLAALRVQRDDLAIALERLLADCVAGKKQMKIYRQFKMYNDPTLNPELYKRAGK